MLKLKYLFENYELAKECLKYYCVDYDTVDKMMQYFRISSNAIYPFRNGNNPAQILFLRLSPIEEKMYEEVVSEIDMINWLISKGFPAMKPVPMNNGKLSDCIDTKWGKFNVSCFECVPGKTLEDIFEDTTVVLDIVRSYGETLGKLHQLMMEYPNAKQRRDHNLFICEIEGRLLQYGAPEKVKKEMSVVKNELSKIPILSENYGVIHYDFELDNVLYDEETGQMGVIDFDDSIRCFYALDVVRAIDSLGDIVSEDMVEDVQKTFFEGYKSKKLFTDDQIKTLFLMRRLVHLQEYSTILHVLSEEIDCKPEWMEGIIAKLKRKQGIIEQSIG